MYWSRVVQDPQVRGYSRVAEKHWEEFHYDVQKWSHLFKARLRGVLCSITETFVSGSHCHYS